MWRVKRYGINTPKISVCGGQQSRPGRGGGSWQQCAATTDRKRLWMSPLWHITPAQCLTSTITPSLTLSRWVVGMQAWSAALCVPPLKARDPGKVKTVGAAAAVGAVIWRGSGCACHPGPLSVSLFCLHFTVILSWFSYPCMHICRLVLGWSRAVRLQKLRCSDLWLRGKIRLLHDSIAINSFHSLRMLFHVTLNIMDLSSKTRR